MRRLALFAALLAGCTLDPRGVVEQASLKVHVEGLVEGGAELVLTARDGSGRQLVKRARVEGKTSVDVLFEAGILLSGEVDLGAIETAADGRELACGTARGAAGAADPVVLPLTSANDDFNCGACGNFCVGAAHAGRSCDPVRAVCAPLVCESGWFNLNADEADGCETTCASPSAEDSVASCSDGLDNDCDGYTDCGDTACEGFTRGCAFGACAGEERWTCATNTWGTCGATASLESTQVTCSDGMDNDCDGKTDCLDEGCASFSQSCNVASCVGQQTWVCASNSFTACAIDDTLEDTVALCKDGQDNDCDGKTDCEETVCQDPRLESTVATCSDGIDNDCDGKKDCQDPGCLNIQQACSGTDVCATGVKLWLCSVRLFGLCSVYVPLPENSGLLCGDGLDNDCDAKRDCADAECTGKGCSLGKICCPNGTCAKTCG